jgi:Putative  PD-(D/E)XK family member, (DUF4420)
MTDDAGTQVDPTDPTDLELRWRTLMRPHGVVLATDRVGEWAGGAVMVALDATGTRHLLVRIADQGQMVRLPRPVAGLGLTARELRPSGQPGGTWIDFACSDSAWNRTFCGLCSDIINELPATGPAEPATMFAVLERWRRFWATDRDGLSRDEQVGLIGELWLLLEWLPRLTVSTVTAWQGPLRGRHDFVTDTMSVEVKTTRAATGPVVHRIAGLDQLDEPGTGTLYLLSLRAVPDPLGTESLDALLTRARNAAAAVGATCAALLDGRLRALGVTHADEGRYTEPLRVALQELYQVGPEFPRLVPASFPTGLPAGVVDVAYSLDTSACQPWLVSDEPDGTPLAALL